ncbi:MAG: VOC family protein [Roseburia sp.]|nr:VOC family protein [Roseburia sp.]
MKDNKIVTYLSFHGNCEEAVNAYISAFGGKILYLTYWDETNAKKESLIGKIMHVEFLLGETNMAAGDDADKEVPNGAMKLMKHMETEEEALKSIEILKKEGKVVSELSPHPKPHDEGMDCLIIDKYGISWIITCPNPRK